jgi:hypothetical protein
MTPKEKAEELYYRFTVHAPLHTDNKQCALIAVDLHLEELYKIKLIFSYRELHYKYWQEVKQEILKL